MSANIVSQLRFTTAVFMLAALGWSFVPVVRSETYKQLPPAGIQVEASTIADLDSRVVRTADPDCAPSQKSPPT